MSGGRPDGRPAGGAPPGGPDRIVSARNERIRRFRALAARGRERLRAGAFLAEGVRLLEEALEAGWTFRQVLVSEPLAPRGRALAGRLEAAGARIDRVSEALIQSLSETKSPQGILAEIEARDLPLPGRMDWILILDGVRDPGNLGSLLRAAAAAGAQAAFLSPGTTDAFSPKAIRAGMGAQFRLPIRAADWNEMERMIGEQGLRVFLAAMDGTPCWDINFRPPSALVIGGEAQGPGERARAVAARRVSVPMPGGMESLNAGVAGGILLFEILRQRRGSLGEAGPGRSR